MTVPSDSRAIASSPASRGTDALRARLFIDGAWIDGAAGTRPVLDKYSGETIGAVDQASRAQVDAAVVSARRSFEHTVTCSSSTSPPPESPLRLPRAGLENDTAS